MNEWVGGWVGGGDLPSLSNVRLLVVIAMEVWERGKRKEADPPKAS